MEEKKHGRPTRHRSSHRESAQSYRTRERDFEAIKSEPFDALNGVMPHTEHEDIYNKNGRIGIYDKKARKKLLAKYHKKRLSRKWRKKIRSVDRRARSRPCGLPHLSLAFHASGIHVAKT